MAEIKGILFVIVNIIIIIAYAGVRFADDETLKKHYKMLFMLLGLLFVVVFLLKKMS